MAENKPFNFISLDGEDEKGIRAEVDVQVNKGVITEIKERTDAGTADVYFKVGALKFPIHGWIPTDDAVYQEVIKAKESGVEVAFRIEAQRKGHVDRSIPIKELRTDASTARENTKVLLVELNGVATSEAVTNPAQDATQTSGRYPASRDDTPVKRTSGNGVSLAKETYITKLVEAASDTRIRQPLLDHLAAQAYLAGVTTEEINEALFGGDKRDDTKPSEAPKPNFATEAPAWKEYNSDGRLNLGSYLVSAALGVESLVYKQMDKASVLETSNRGETLEYFTNLVFAICDRVQVSTYGANARVDRAAGSHIRARGIVYDVIERLYPLPLTKGLNNVTVINGGAEGVQKWVASVGVESRDRFLRAIKSSTEYYKFSEIVPPASLLSGETTTVPVSEVEQLAIVTPILPVVTTASPVVEEVEVTTEAEVSEEPKLEENVELTPEVVEVVEVLETNPVVLLDASREERLEAAKNLIANPAKVNKKPLIPADDDDVSEIVLGELPGVLAPLNLNENDSRELATGETIQSLQVLLAESGFDIKDKADMARISKLLAYTFGEKFSNARKIPNEELEMFIDHYVFSGTEGLTNAIELALGRA